MKKNIIYTREICQLVANKYKNKLEFNRHSPKASSESKKNGWYEEITAHYVKTGNLYSRAVYMAKFDTNEIYIGLTYNFEIRKSRHLQDSDSPVYQAIKRGAVLTCFKLLTGYIDAYKAQKLEIKLINKIKIFSL